MGILTITITAALLASALPSTALAPGLGAPVAPAAWVVPDFCAAEAGGSAHAEAALLAVCAGIRLANGDVAGANAAALDATARLYGDQTLAPRVIETYAHQYVFLQNPVLNPGFLITEEKPSSEPHPGPWEGTFRARSGGIEIRGDETAWQSFGVAQSGGALETGDVLASPYWGPDTLSLDYEGAGTATVTLGFENADTWTIDIALPAHETLGNARFSLLEAVGADTLVVGEAPFTQTAEAALPASALLGIAFATDDRLTVDNVVLDGVAYGPEARAAVELDAPNLLGDTLGRFLPDLTADSGYAHDGHSTVIIPLEYVPAIVSTDAAQLVENVEAFAIAGTWTFFVGVIEHSPSGPAFIMPKSVKLDTGRTSSGWITDFAPLAGQGDAGAAFAGLLVAQGFTDVHGAVASMEIIDPSDLGRLFVDAQLQQMRYDGADHVYGFFNYAKLVEPGRATNDLQDIVPESLYPAREALAGATYTSERKWDTNDGYVGTLRPHGAVPVAGGAPLDNLLLPDLEGRYRFELAFQDYQGRTVDGQYAFVAFYSAQGFAKAQDAIAAGSPEWFELAGFTVCDVTPSFLPECERFMTKTAGVYELAIPVDFVQDLQEGLGGEFFAIAFLHVPGTPVDQELLGTVPARAAYNPAVNAMVDVANDFGIGAGSVRVGPSWLYAAADAQSMAGAPLQFAPASDALDGYAVLIAPLAVDDAGTILPNIQGEYEFEVRFRAYRDGGPLADETRLPVDYLGFHLTDAPSQASGSLWSRRLSADGSADQLLDRYVVRVPAYEIPVPADEAAEARQAITAWSSTWHPAWGGPSDPRADWITDDDAHLIGGFYNAQKNAVAANAVADQLDNLPGVLVFDRAIETYGVNVTALTPADNVDRASETVLQFRLENAGAFEETFDLQLVESEEDMDAAFATGGLTTSVTLPPNSETVVDVIATVGSDADNGEALALALVATLPHEVRPGVAFEAVTATSTLTVAPLAFTVEVLPPGTKAVVPGADDAFDFRVANTGEITESFALAATGSSTVIGPDVSPDATASLGPGESADATLRFTLDGAAKYGSSAVATFSASPDHKGAAKLIGAAIQVPDSSITVTATGADIVNAKPGDVVEHTFTAEYQTTGGYTETFDVTATHSVLTDALTTVLVDGIPADQVTFVGPGTRTLTVRFAIPDTTPLGTVDTTTLALATVDTLHSDATDSAQRQVTLATASLVPTAPAIEYRLQGETISWEVPFTYEGDIGWSFGLEAVDFPAGLQGVALDADTLTFGPTGMQTVTVTATVASDLAYSTSLPFALRISSLSGPWTGAQLLDVPLTGQIFSLATPSVTTPHVDHHAFPRDVKVDVDFEVGFSLPVAEHEAWDAREQDITFDLALTNALDDEYWNVIVPTSVTAGRTAPGAVRATLTPLGLPEDDAFTLTAMPTGLPREIAAGSESIEVEVYTASDIVVHTMLFGCYGENADTCDRVFGPVQSLATHDLPGTAYSRVWITAAPILVHEGASYVPFAPINPDPAFSGITGSATVQALTVDANIPDTTRVSTTQALPGDERFQVLEADGQFVAFPDAPALAPGLTTRSGITSLLWETTDSESTTWFLDRLGTLDIAVTLDVHGIVVTRAYAPERAVLPLLGDDGAAGLAMAVPDKDDADGDGYANVAELRGNSNPLLRSSHPYSDEDDDGYVNLRDVLGFVHEECLMQDALDADWTACIGGPAAGLDVPPVPGVTFGPAEFMAYVRGVIEQYGAGHLS